MRARVWAILACAALAAASGSAPARAAQCGDSPDGFAAWLQDFKQVAINDGVSPDVVDQALATAKFDPSVLSHDRGQGALQGDFAILRRAAYHAGPDQAGASRCLSPTPSRSSASSSATACRGRCWSRSGASRPTSGRASAAIRPSARWRPSPTTAGAAISISAELIDALMIVQRGLLTPQQMRGAWAGELGQTQFMPSAYLKYGVSSNGGRGGDLIGNSADALASTANFLHSHGWQRGREMGRGPAELRRPARMERLPGLRQDHRGVRRQSRRLLDLHTRQCGYCGDHGAVTAKPFLPQRARRDLPEVRV